MASFERWSGSSTATETKAPHEHFEYDDANHSTIPTGRKLSTNSADLMRRNASGEHLRSKKARGID